MEDLLETHTALIAQIAADIAVRLPRSVPRRDLISWGQTGLYDAARRHDPAKGKFTTFARHRIRGAMLDGLRSFDPASRDCRKQFRRTQDTVRLLAIALGREPDEEETARALGISLSEWQALRSLFGRIGLISDPTTSHMDADRLPGTVADPFESALTAERRSMLGRAIATLPARYQTVILLYYRRGLTMKEIGTRLGVNESRVSQIHQAALGRLKQELSPIPPHALREC